MSIDGYKQFTTRAGDTFDYLALAAYNDEKLASYIIAANPDYSGTLIFGAGVTLQIPVLKDVDVPQTLPPWRR
ncbi:MAG: LysM domain-containing protein [bacterium]|nr:LysM domain-containing protein [bacterium]